MRGASRPRRAGSCTARASGRWAASWTGSWPRSTPVRQAAAELVRADLALLAPHCHWTAGTLGRTRLRWNEIQNVPRHIHELSSYLIRTYLQARRRSA